MVNGEAPAGSNWAGAFPKRSCWIGFGLLRSRQQWGRRGVVTKVRTVAFRGIEALLVDVQVQIAPGIPTFLIVGLPERRTFRLDVKYKF